MWMVSETEARSGIITTQGTSLQASKVFVEYIILSKELTK